MLADYIAAVDRSSLSSLGAGTPWAVTVQAERIVRALLATLPNDDYAMAGDVAVHRTARIEAGATIKGPAIVSAGCFVASHSLLRGGIWLDERCSIGPGCEVKSSFLFSGARLAHFNFVGDSIIGRDVNFEAGSVVANRRNERSGSVRVHLRERSVDTGCDKFGALIGDGARIGANAVLAPGTLLAKHTVVPRLGLVDHERPQG